MHKKLDLKFNDSILTFENGITATSAQHLCNIAKEMYAEIESDHKSIQFYTENLENLSSTPKVLSHGQTKTYLPVLDDDLRVLVELKSFIAYFKEAIKYKDDLFTQYNKISFAVDDYPELNGYAMFRPSKRTIADYLKDLPIKERCKFFTLETKCAVLGSFVHPDGGLSVARKKLINIKNNPTELLDSDTDTLIKTFVPTIELEDVNELFFKVQQEHRRTQAEFNKMKSDIEKILETEYRQKVVEVDHHNNVWFTEKTKLESSFLTAKEEVLNKIQTLKIIVPDDLQRTFKTLSPR